MEQEEAEEPLDLPLQVRGLHGLDPRQVPEIMGEVILEVITPLFPCFLKHVAEAKAAE